MNNNAIQRSIIFAVIVLLQCFIFSRLPLGTYLQPAVYIWFVLMLPFHYSQAKTLLWAFVLGFCIDLLTTDVIGINTAATVAIAFVRPQLLKLFSTKSEFDMLAIPTPRTLGLRPYIGYVTIAALLHQTVFFFLDSFGFYDIPHTLLRILASTACTVLFVALLPKNRKSVK